MQKRVSKMENQKTTKGKEKVIRNRRQRETMPGNSQSIETRCSKCVGVISETGKGVS